MHEEACALRLNGKLQPGSGSRPHSKLDVRTELFLVECKVTSKKSFSVSAALLEKVRREAAKEGKIGVVEMSIQGRVFYVVPEAVMEMCTEGAEL